MKPKKDKRDIRKNRTLRMSDNEFEIIEKKYKKSKSKEYISRWQVNVLLDYKN